MNPVSALVVDTSIWIAYFRGEELPLVDRALKDGVVILPAVVAAELMSGVRRTAKAAELRDFLNCLRWHGLDPEHWIRVGILRAQLGKKGLSISTPDAHVAQCALDLHASLYALDHCFPLMAKQTALQLVT